MIIGIKSAHIQQVEEFIEEPNPTITHTNNEDISVKIDSTNIPQSQTEDGIKVQDVNCGKYERVPMELPSQTDGKFKTYMSYKLISNMTSDQFKLQQQAYTDEYGFRRVGDAYCIALASAYGTEIGTRYYIVLETGVEFIGILSDCKQNIHTDSTNKYIEKNGNIIEWIVDTDKIDNLSKKMGDVSYAGFEGGVVSIERIEEVTE